MNSVERLRLGDVDVEFQYLIGNTPEQTLVCLHEGLGCVALWRDFPRTLSEATGYSVLTYSRAGYGASSGIELPRPLNHLRIEARNFLPRLLRKLDIVNPTIVGHSDGATIAIEYAAAFPDQLKSLVLMAPHVFVEAISINSIHAIREQFVGGDLRDKLVKYHGENVDNAFYGWADTWLNENFRTWNIEDILVNIVVPILQIQGAADAYGTPAQNHRIERGVRSDVVYTHILADCGHAPHLEKPAETLQLIADFVQRGG